MSSDTKNNIIKNLKIFLSVFIISIFFSRLTYSQVTPAISKLSKKSKKTFNTSEVSPVLPKKEKIIVQRTKVRFSSVDKNSEIVGPIQPDHKSADLIKEFLNSRKMGINDSTSTFDILSTSTFKGKLLNSIKSSNLESPIKIMITSQDGDLPYGAILSCAGITVDRSVKTICSKLIVNGEEYSVDVSVLNMDGTSGLRGEVYTGDEEALIGTLASAYLRSSLSTAQEIISTPTGEIVKNTNRNRVLGGTIGVLDEGIEKLDSEMKGRVVKVVIEAGTDVIIYFQQRFKIWKDH